MTRSRLPLVAVVVAFGLMYLPLLTVVAFSFNASSAPVLPITGLSTVWYEDLFADSAMWDAFLNTLKIGAATVVVSLVLSTLAALAIRHRQFPGRSAYEFLIGLPFLLPEVVTGLALLTFFTELGLSLSLTTILLGHTLFCIGAAFRVVAARLEALPGSLEEAARDLGRGPIGAFWRVTVPAMRSALVTAAVLVFALSFDQTIITILVTGTENTLPTFLWAKLRIGFTPELNALATMIFLTTILLCVPLAMRARPEELV